MKKMSTLIYMYSNFEEKDMLSENFSEFSLEEFDDILKLLDESTVKAPDIIVHNVLEFARNYS